MKFVLSFRIFQHEDGFKYGMDKYSILIADDHVLYAEALSAILGLNDDPVFEVLGVVHSGNHLLSKMDRYSPDCILLDLNMPDGAGLDVLPVLKKNYPGSRVLVVTMYDDTKFIKEVFKAKGDGYFLKSNPYLELVEAIRLVMDGETYLSNGLKVFPKEITDNGDEAFDDDFQLIHRLTPRELEILQLISLAKSNKQIADELYISDQTVMVHRKNIMRKLSVTNTAGLIKFALDHDLT